MTFDKQTLNYIMGLRQKFKRFKHFMSLVTTVIAMSQLLYPFAVRAELDAQGSCLIPTVTNDATIASCADNACISRDKTTTIQTKKTIAVKTTRVIAQSSAAIVTDIESVPKKALVADKEANHGFHSMTAYTSEAAQTDSSPCTTANGFNVCEHNTEDTVAANFLPMGAKVKIPDLFGDRVFIVRDRMNSRYSERVDVWMKDKSDAMQFGVRTARLVVLK
jgi:3D (Asp-Asp-Asp) domain-containing protein